MSIICFSLLLLFINILMVSSQSALAPEPSFIIVTHYYKNDCLGWSGEPICLPLNECFLPKHSSKNGPWYKTTFFGNSTFQEIAYDNATCKELSEEKNRRSTNLNVTSCPTGSCCETKIGTTHEIEVFTRTQQQY